MAPYYPQSSSWNDQITGDVDYESSADDVSHEMPSRNPFSSVPKRTAEVPTDDYNGSSPKISNSLKTGSSNKDTLEFQTLVAQLNSTLEQLKRQEEEKRRNKRRGTQKPNIKEEIEDEGPELIYVNIWNNVGGKLKLAGQKPMLKESFDEMQSKKDFSSLLNPSPSSYFPEPSWHSNYHTGSSVRGSEHGQTSHPYQQRYQFPEEPRQGGQSSPESRLPLPSSLQALIPPTSQSLWTSASSSPALGVGTDFAQPSFKDSLNQDTGHGFLQNPSLVEKPLGQISYVQNPPNFTPIPLPQVTPSAN